MKTSSFILVLFLAQNANAFAPAGSSKIISLCSVATNNAEIEVPKVLPDENSLKYEEEVNAEQKWKVNGEDPLILDPRKRVQTGRYNNRDMSLSVPFLKRPANLDGSHAGDVGFDPLGISEESDLYTLMEAEIRHARLAMLAVVGWPLAELVGPNFLLQGPNHIAPSVLNGFSPVSFLAMAVIFGGFGFFEYTTSLRRTDDKELGMIHKEDMANVWKYGVPGDYNFDPLGLYSMFGDNAAGRKGMRELEIAHGRWAMVGISLFAALEALTGHPVVENNMFFHPNLVLPLLGIAYLSFGFFYEVKNNDQYLLQIEMSSEGKSRTESIKKSLTDTVESTQDTFKFLSNGSEMASKAVSGLKEKIEGITS